ncbi:hypothetical protein AAZX31_06G214200 [Glycine max]|uniref:Uncharacterized protein n=1 Tax=Glycine max TaxID=3847 RepID=K7KWS7_SOYBN|nr:uncharacterized protein LOC102666876 isoform X2 [Glycine max]KAG5032580.1 hypothetical protein JHK85_016562 [Glycine max]KAH1127219.1 hypothetical protein GYH30_015980 [Glycine max]KRH55082.1 hypothetical protein GLYMA_06G229200v4 [Glycine max]|eukprot:XP_006582124.1 uncharacterized protein LOC102666876 isoform X2 [Glycine max]
MDPYDEKRLRDEVIYLHYLWHQGPPRPPPQNPITHRPFPSPSQPYIPQHTWHARPHQQQPAPARTRSLPPAIPTTTTTSFKKKKKHKRNTPEKNVSQPDPGPEWPCPVRPEPSPTTGWAQPKPKPGSASPPPEVAPEEKERLVAMQAQHKACKALKEFLSNNYDDDDDDDDDDDESECEEIEEFFLVLFLEDHELRGYYQRCYENGLFCCLVCGAIGKKNSGKRFKDCVGLLQHSMSILRTMKKRVHRGFGMALCKVLGWDSDRFPAIVMKGTPLGMEMMTPVEAEGEPKENNAADDNDRKDDSHESDDKVLSLEHGDVAAEVPAQRVDQSMNKGEHDGKDGEDHGENGAHKSGDEVVSLGLGDEPVEEHAQGDDQSINKGEA